MEEKYTYDDVLLVPQRSDVESRSNIDISTNVTPQNEIESPLVSAPMDSVTGSELAQAMADEGGCGVIHRFQGESLRTQAVKQVDGTVGATVGLDRDEKDIAVSLQRAGADFICVDVAHGHLEECINQVRKLNQVLSCDIMVGNVVTPDAVKDLVSAGADSVKIGVGPGSHCTTREKTGVGYPQFSAIRDIYKELRIWQKRSDVTLVADGGIRNPGNATKALMAGADCVMMGGIFGRCEESIGGGNVWGMASEKGKEKISGDGYVEGEVSHSEEKYKVADVFEEFEDGIRSGLSYCGGRDIKDARALSEFVLTTSSTNERNGAFEV